MTDTFPIPVNNIRFVRCNDPDHVCYGKLIRVMDGVWKGHHIHIEKISENEFNVQVDGGALALELSYDQMVEYIRGKVE